MYWNFENVAVASQFVGDVFMICLNDVIFTYTYTKIWELCIICLLWGESSGDWRDLLVGHLMPRSHQTRSQYVLQNVAERGQTVCERNERCDNCLESFYELNGRCMDAVDGKDISERRDCSKSWGDHPVPKLDEVTTCLKRDGRSTNGIAVLRTY